MSNGGVSFLDKYWRWLLAGVATVGIIAIVVLPGGRDNLRAIQSASPSELDYAEPAVEETWEAGDYGHLASIEQDVAPGPDASKIYSDEFTAVLTRIGLPAAAPNGVDMPCSSLATQNKRIQKAEVCNAVSISPCVFSSNDTCEVSATLVNERVAWLNYRYADWQITPPEAKAALDRLFHPVKWKEVPKLTFPDGHWIVGQTAEWKSGSIKILLMLNGGLNVQGEYYQNASLIISDHSLPEP